MLANDHIFHRDRGQREKKKRDHRVRQVVKTSKYDKVVFSN